MKKNVLFLLVFVLVQMINAQVFQNNLENWTDNHHPIGFWGAKTNIEVDSVNQYTTSSHSGVYAVQLVNTESTHKRFTTQPIQVDSGTTYTISFWVRGKGNIRTGIYDGRATGSGYFYNTYINVNTTTWEQYSQTIICEKTNAAGEFIFSVQLTNSANEHIQIDDVLITANSPTSPTLIITYPSNNAQIYSSNVNIQYTTTNFVVGTDGKIKYTINGTNPNYTVDNPILLSGLTQGTYNIQLELIDMNHNSLTPPVTASVSFTITSSLPQYVSIHDIQYTTDQTGNSPYADDTIQTSGIVTGTYAQGFFLQNGSGEWNGIFVFSATYAPQVSIGDSVTIVGKVKEYYGLTEITNLSYIQVHSQNNPLPSPIVVTAAQVKSEPYEGVLVKLMNATCINENSGYGMWTVQDATDTCKIHNLLYTYTPTLNHKYHITGPVYYSYGEYRIEPRSMNDVEDVTAVALNELIKTTIYPNPVNDKLNVVSEKNISEIKIYDLKGSLIEKRSINNTTTTLSLQQLAKGTYTINIVFENKAEQKFSFIKE